MNLDDAFKMAAKKFYEGSMHGSVSSYSKRDFGYSVEALDELKKKYKAPVVEEAPEEEETPEHEMMPDDLEEDMDEEELS